MSSIRPERTFGFFLIPGFSLVALSCAIDVLRAANVEAGTNQSKRQFGWQLLGNDGPAIKSSSGIGLPVNDIEHQQSCHVIAVCGGERSHLYTNNDTLIWLRQQARMGKVLGSISDGAYVAAEAGLFDGCKSTIHWKCQSAYRERFPDLDIRTSILEIQNKRFSCAGGTASLDLMLQFVLEISGPKIVSSIADNYFHDVIRGDDQVQHMTSAFRFAGRDKTLSDALLLMEQNLEEPLSIAKIVSALNSTPRQLDRLFRRHLNTSPSAHYRDMRMSRASGLLKQSSLSVGEIAIGCGFQSASHLSKFFKQKFGKTPLQHRRQT